MLCLCICQCSDYFGLSLELGSFLAGVMISTTDFAHHTLEQVLFCIQSTFLQLSDFTGNQLFTSLFSFLHQFKSYKELDALEGVRL